MGARRRGADLVIITDDNPRSEEPAAIRAAVLAGAPAVAAEQRRATDIREVGDRAAAIADAVAGAVRGRRLDHGKGHETGRRSTGSSTISTIAWCFVRR